MKILISLPGLHRVDRGAEVALEAIGQELAALDENVVVLGGGRSKPGRSYEFRHVPVIDRGRFARFPAVPMLREPASYEGMLYNLAACRHRLGEVDVTVTCGYPWDNVFLRRRGIRRSNAPHVFITENGDWPAFRTDGEARFFGCDGLVCTNPVYFERNAQRWRSALIPNGVDVDRFTPGPGERARLNLPDEGPIVLMVSALIPSKRVDAGIRAVAGLDGVTLVVAGAGPEAPALEQLGAELLGERFICTTFLQQDMPALYRSADLLLHLSHLESFGNVYVEALATGLPVVAHESPVTKWILGDEGTLLDTDDPQALEDAIDSCLREGRVSGEDQRVARATGSFSWRAVGEQYQAFLAEIVGVR
jgi:glycosyltransferase involved in cell wall biosynthesis